MTAQQKNIDWNALSRLDYAAFGAMFFYATTENALPICLVSISKELNFTLTQAGFLGFVTLLGKLLIFWACCLLAARFGKIRVIKGALLLTALGLFLFSFSTSFLLAVALMLIVGFGNSFLEALLTPLMIDLHAEDSGAWMNLLHAFWPIGVCVSVLLIGELLSWNISWRFIFAGLALLSIILFSYFPAAKDVSLPQSRADFSHMREIISLPRFWSLSLGLYFAGAAELAFAFWSATYIQIHYAVLPRAGAYGAVAFAMGMIIGRILATHLAPRWGLRQLILGSALGALCASSCILLIEVLTVFYGFMIVMGILIGCFWPSIQAYGGKELAVDSTILMIFFSCFGMLGCSFAVVVMGVLGDIVGLQLAFMIAPLSLALLIVCMFIDGWLSQKGDGSN